MIKVPLALLLAAGVLAPGQGIPQIGQPAPGFDLEALGGGRMSLAELRGRPVLVNFWASWCNPCRDEMPQIVLRYRKLHQAGGLEVLAINLTDQERKKDVQRFAEEFQLPFPILLDVRGKVRQRYGLVGVPMTVFVDATGVVAAVHTGPMTPETLDRGLAAILRLP